ncbi:hypothetical protein [Clostridium tagluense]|uniref:Uncharacterized protein n=1 Tax=Clostridium tagluense TaxID=360422 RepID=A0A401UM35_9CLOT|nr:hypothetical protein [Clostridium tagluense]GCD10603.1 hypothetical protein Ctaglu_22260 [Clostridium tagluense]
MSKATWLNIGGAWKQAKNIWVNVGGVWKQKIIPKGNVNEVWKDFISYIYIKANLVLTKYPFNVSVNIHTTPVMQSNSLFAEKDGFYLDGSIPSVSVNRVLSKFDSNGNYLYAMSISDMKATRIVKSNLYSNTYYVVTNQWVILKVYDSGINLNEVSRCHLSNSCNLFKIDENDNLYLTYGSNIQKINKDYTVLNTYTDIGIVKQMTQDGLYVYTNNEYIAKRKLSDKSIIWSIPNSYAEKIEIDENDNIYVVDKQNPRPLVIKKYTSNGVLAWSTPLDDQSIATSTSLDRSYQKYNLYYNKGLLYLTCTLDSLFNSSMNSSNCLLAFNAETGKLLFGDFVASYGGDEIISVYDNILFCYSQYNTQYPTLKKWILS